MTVNPEYQFTLAPEERIISSVEDVNFDVSYVPKIHPFTIHSEINLNANSFGVLSLTNLRLVASSKEIEFGGVVHFSSQSILGYSERHPFKNKTYNFPLYKAVVMLPAGLVLTISPKEIFHIKKEQISEVENKYFNTGKKVSSLLALALVVLDKHEDDSGALAAIIEAEREKERQRNS